MVFLPGDHALDTNITVTSVTSLMMRGESSSSSVATLVCKGPVGLHFSSMVNFRIHSLTFTACNRKHSVISATLLLQSTQYAELVDCSFHDNLASALAVDNTGITLSGKTEFTHNHCEFCLAGGVIALSSSNLTFTGNTTFLGNRVGAIHKPSQGCGGAVYAFQNTTLTFNGTTNFVNNLADHNGSAIYALLNTALSFYGTSNFINNSAGYGGAIYAVQNTVLGFIGTNSFINNSADHLGGAIYAGNTTLTFYGTTNFTSNTAGHNGSAIYAVQNTILNFFGTTNFISNSAHYSAGTIYALNNTAVSFSGTNNFLNNSAERGGAISLFFNTTFSFNGTNNFINNSAKITGGAIHAADNTALNFSNGTNHFVNNTAIAGGVIFISKSVINFTNGTNKFINNTAFKGGAIRLIHESALVFNADIYFVNNGGRGGYTLGGGMYIEVVSTFSILPNATVYWENNHATRGGAIYVEDFSTCNPDVKEECFFQLPGQNLSSLDVQLVFKNNSADDAGSALYGGAIDHCKLTHGLDSSSSGAVFDMIFHSEDDNTTSDISSDPLRVCPCKNFRKNCDHTFPRDVYPGETVQVSAFAFGQRNGTVSSMVGTTIFQGVIEANATEIWILGPAYLQDSQYFQKVNNNCTELKYTVHSLSQYVGIILRAKTRPCSNELWSAFYFKLNLTCPPGFKLLKSAKSCVCEPRLAKYEPQCNITNGTGQITRQSGQKFWVGCNNASHGVILHPRCPFDYCVNDAVVFSLDETDLQCAYNKSGLLCGRCKEGYSLVLGTSQCRKCTNSHLVLLIPFAVMGVALVFLLLVCKLTVATGTLSGLVFYANIVEPNRNIFLPVESTNAFSVFIAWLNLDFGIKTCFYDGLDTYSKTWLQFVFPVYIWVLVGLMVQVSRFSQRFARLLGNNPVSVLATLILLSYTKILRTLIAVLYLTYLEYPKYNRMVWLYDGNIDYLSGKHIPLFLVAMLVFLFLFLPYTLLLFFGQWLQAISHLRLFSWVNRLKPFMDSYHAPYKAKYRYWPGLLLVLRFVLLLVFAFQFNPQQDRVSINLLAILVGAGILVVWAGVSGGVYRNWRLGALEGSFALNLIILVGATFYVKRTEGAHLAAGYTSVSIAFATFIGILIFHLTNVTSITQYLKRKCAAVANRNGHQVEVEVEPVDNGSLPDRLMNPREYETSFHIPNANAEPAEEELVNEAQRRLTPVYTYGSIS